MTNVLKIVESIKYKNKTFILNDELKIKLLETMSKGSDKQSLKEEANKCVEV